jgi:GAF domain-containing protein
VGTALEITPQKQAEEEAEPLRKATLSLTQDLRMDFIMETRLRSLEELARYTCARVLVPESGPHMLALGERTCPEQPKKSPRSYDLCRGGVNVFPFTNTEKKWHTFKGHRQLRSWLSAPLITSGEYLGCLSVGHTQPNLYTQDHLRRAELLAIPAAAAIQNARLYETACIYGKALEGSRCGP